MFNPNDYPANRHEEAHIAFLEQQERIELADIAAEEAEEEHEREMAFRETPFCVAECYDTMIHGVMCEAIAGWRRAQAIAWTVKEAA